jgi:D-amino-acid dehydrogenase
MAVRTAVVGAGIVGLATASHLVRRGCDVTLIDPEPPGEACSFGNAGCLSRASCVPLGLPGLWKKVPGWLLDRDGPFSIRWRYALALAPWLWQLHRNTSMARVAAIADALHPLVNPSIDKWRTLAEWAGASGLIRQQGYGVAYESEAAFAADRLGRELRRARGVRLEVLTGGAIRECEPALAPSITHFVLMPEQGHVTSPLRLSRALATRLASAGATFVRAKALDFDRRDGRVAAVMTSTGRVECDAVVLATGAWSKALAARLGSRVPLEAERGVHVMLTEPSLTLRMPICSGEGKYFATSMEDGLRVAGTVELASVDAPANYARTDALLRGTKRLLPGLQWQAVTRWMGCRPSLPDSLPVIGRSRECANAFFAFGHGHVGLTCAAPTGELVADLVMGTPTAFDVSTYSPARFALRGGRGLVPRRSECR